jgi:hypothetical protein
MGNSRAASDVIEMKLKNNNISQEDITSDTLSPKRRRNFARGITQQDKSGSTGIKNLSSIAPSAHHRFDRENVHLRTMFRKLYPSVPGPHTTQSGLVREQGSSESLVNGDISRFDDRKVAVPVAAMGGLGGIGK